MGGAVGGAVGLAAAAGLLALALARRRRKRLKQARRAALSRPSDIKPSARPFIAEVSPC